MRYVVLATDSSETYKGFDNVVSWCWHQLGWQTILIDVKDLRKYKELDKYPSALLAQVVRLFASQLYYVNENDYLMTSDIDMIPLKDFNEYFIYDENNITTFGHDLTNFEQIPICYIGMKASKWRKVFNLEGLTIVKALEKYLEEYPNEWTTDQTIATDKICRYPFTNIPRGFREIGTIPFGRLDRFDWQRPEKNIDCHSLRPLVGDNWDAVKYVLTDNFGQTREFFDTIK